jgi:hypothetical protein
MLSLPGACSCERCLELHSRFTESSRKYQNLCCRWYLSEFHDRPL